MLEKWNQRAGRNLVRLGRLIGMVVASLQATEVDIFSVFEL